MKFIFTIYYLCQLEYHSRGRKKRERFLRCSFWSRGMSEGKGLCPSGSKLRNHNFFIAFRNSHLNKLKYIDILCFTWGIDKVFGQNTYLPWIFHDINRIFWTSFSSSTTKYSKMSSVSTINNNDSNYFSPSAIFDIYVQWNIKQRKKQRQKVIVGRVISLGLCFIEVV